jgi:hypothetical protein
MWEVRLRRLLRRCAAITQVENVKGAGIGRQEEVLRVEDVDEGRGVGHCGRARYRNLGNDLPGGRIKVLDEGIGPGRVDSYANNVSFSFRTSKNKILRRNSSQQPRTSPIVGIR